MILFDVWNPMTFWYSYLLIVMTMLVLILLLMIMAYWWNDIDDRVQYWYSTMINILWFNYYWRVKYYDNWRDNIVCVLQTIIDDIWLWWKVLLLLNDIQINIDIGIDVLLWLLLILVLRNDDPFPGVILLASYCVFYSDINDVPLLLTQMKSLHVWRAIIIFFYCVGVIIIQYWY